MNPLDAAASSYSSPFIGFSHTSNVSDIVVVSVEHFQTLRTPFSLGSVQRAAFSEFLERAPIDQVNSAWRLIEHAININ